MSGGAGEQGGALQCFMQRGFAPRPLDNITKQLVRLGSPDRAFRTVQAAGTNGKGSVCAMLASILRASGLRVGLFTSPALVDIRERIRVDGEMIPLDDLTRLAEKVVGEERKGFHFSGFDRLTLAAALYFAEQKADAAVFECGLGGRLDPTTALKRHCTVLTRVDLDHTAILGDTLGAIAAEKAAILRRNVPAVVAPQDEPAREAILRRAEETEAPVIELLPENITACASGLWGQEFSLAYGGRRFDGLRIPFAGAHQLENASLAVMAAHAFFPPEEAALRSGLEGAQWPCRFELFPATDARVRVILDGAHNPAGARALADAIRALLPQPPELLLAIRADKDAKAMLEALAPAVARVFLAEAGGVAPETLAAYCRECGVGCAVLGENYLQEALALSESGTLVAAGSLYFVGGVRGALVG